MSPRPGGEADKFGNRYEGRWTVLYALYCLNSHDVLTVEDFRGDLARGVEFVYEPAGGSTQVHQVKRQSGTAGSWTIRALHSAKVWGYARSHIEAGRQFHFVSTIPSPIVAALSDLARRTNSLEQFVMDAVSKELDRHFTELSSPALLSDADNAWTVLRGFYVHSLDEATLVNVCTVLADELLEGASGRTAIAAIGDLISEPRRAPDG